MLLLVLNATPALPDDRQLLRLGGGTNILVILDSSSSMMNDFGSVFDLPAYMDDFVYPQGTVAATNGSKLGVAKSVLREVITKSDGVNWAFATYRDSNPTFGASMTGTALNGGFPGQAMDGATKAGDPLKNGGLEWLYVSQCGSLTVGGTCSEDRSRQHSRASSPLPSPVRLLLGHPAGALPPTRPQGPARLQPGGYAGAGDTLIPSRPRPAS
jgi:hypothetical protein